MVYGGIDPGLSGALVKLNRDGSIIDYMSMPFKDKRHDYDTIIAFMMDVRVCGLEQLLITNTTGKKGVQSSGIGYGRLQACLFYVGATEIEVPIKSGWQKMYTSGFSGNSKERALKAAKMMYKDVDFCGMTDKMREGVVDALLIANYTIEMEKRNGKYE